MYPCECWDYERFAPCLIRCTPRKVDVRPGDTALIKAQKTLKAYEEALPECEENKRLEEERRNKGFFGRLFS